MAFSQPNCGCNPVNGYTGCDCPCTGDEYFKALQCACNTTHGANCAAVTTYCGGISCVICIICLIGSIFQSYSENKNLNNDPNISKQEKSGAEK